MAEAIHTVQEVRKSRTFFFVIVEVSFSRLKELLEQYKLERPDPEFADDHVIERGTKKFRVEKRLL